MKTWFGAIALATGSLLLCAGITNGAQADKSDVVIVTASFIPSPAEEVGSSVTVLDADRIESSKSKMMVDLVRGVPGLHVARSGGPGKMAAVYIRGAESEQTLFVIDGVEMNDPIAVAGSYGLDLLLLNNIDRIEILRGPQSTIYGSDAIGGVVNIITKRGEGPPVFTLSAEGGSFATFKGMVGVRGGGKRLNYSFGLSRFSTAGISTAGEEYDNSEADAYENTSGSLRLGFTPSENFDITLSANTVDSENALDNGGGAGGDDPNYKAWYDQWFVRVQPRLFLLDGLWEQKLGVSFARHDRTYRNDPDAAHPGELIRSAYESRNVKVDWQHNLRFGETHTVTLGLESEEQQGESEYYSEGVTGPFSDVFDRQTARTTSAYLQEHLRLWGKWFTTLGLRLDDHSKAGSELTYRAASAYRFKETGTRLKATVGTGFKAPSLFRLYSSYGDPDLKPEKSVGWDAGVEQDLFDGVLTLGATFFQNDHTDMIDFDLVAGTYNNVAEAKAQGVELCAAVRPLEHLVLSVDYTRTDTEDSATGEPLLRRPADTCSLNANYRIPGKTSIDVGVLYVGSRKDMNPATFAMVDVDAYTLANVAVAYDINNHVQVFARVENVLDTQYEEAKGYGAPGLAGYGGVQATF